MTTEEAIEILSRPDFFSSPEPSNEEDDALFLAIEALKEKLEREKGG